MIPLKTVERRKLSIKSESWVQWGQIMVEQDQIMSSRLGSIKSNSVES